MSLWGILPDPPSTPGDTDAAREHHQRIVALLDADDAEKEAKPITPRSRPRQFPRLTKYQRVYLRELEARWLKRAIGADLRWNLYGNDKHGRLPKAFEAACRGETIRAEPPPPAGPDPELAAWIGEKDQRTKEL